MRHDLGVPPSPTSRSTSRGHAAGKIDRVGSAAAWNDMFPEDGVPTQDAPTRSAPAPGTLADVLTPVGVDG